MTAGLMIAITASARLMKTTPQIAVMSTTAISTPKILLCFSWFLLAHRSRWIELWLKLEVRVGVGASLVAALGNGFVEVGAVYSRAAEASTTACSAELKARRGA